MQFALETNRECIQMTTAIRALLMMREKRLGHPEAGCTCAVGRALRLYEGAVEYLVECPDNLDANQRT